MRHPETGIMSADFEVDTSRCTKFGAMHGEPFFKRRVIRYEWPVLGSHAAERIDDPAAYFDLCARRIRVLNPRRVRAMVTGAEPPESFGVCR